MRNRFYQRKPWRRVLVLCTIIVQAVAAQPQQNLEPFSHFGGWPDGAMVRGDYAYLIQGTVLTVLDVSGAEFHRVASLLLPAEPADIVLQGDYAFLVEAGSDSAVQVVNISDPLAPAFVKRMAVTTGWPVRAFMADNFLYIAGNEQLQVIDATDPQQPAVAGSRDVPAIDVFVRGQQAFVGGSDGLHVLDVSNPAKIKQVSFVETGGINAICLQGDYAFMTGFRNVDPKVEFTIYDISDPANPESQQRRHSYRQMVSHRVARPHRGGRRLCLSRTQG